MGEHMSHPLAVQDRRAGDTELDESCQDVIHLFHMIDDGYE
jgi:hypothetical protein